MFLFYLHNLFCVYAHFTFFSVGYILNITMEIDNFYPNRFVYHNVRLYDIESSELLKYWDETYKFLSKAK